MTPAQAQTLATYNRWLNEKLYAIVAAIADEDRKHDRQVFFKSIHGTLNHGLLADKIWLSRFMEYPFSAIRLVMLIESYEADMYPMGELSGHEILQHIMEPSGTRQADLVGVLGSSGVVSEIVNGKRTIIKAPAKILGEMFKVSPSLFI